MLGSSTTTTTTSSMTVITYKRDNLSQYAGLPFRFKLQAQNYIGYSTPSDYIRILVADVPSAPAAPFKVASGKTFITIGWTAPLLNGGKPVISYNIYVRPPGGSYTLAQVHLNLTSFIYTYQVSTALTGQTF